jgi:Inner membrane protein YgaP-like, transmembrane domain
MFKQNVGRTDRVIRIALGILLPALGMLVVRGTIGTVISIIGLIPLVTGLVGVCPLYLAFKFSTNK